MNARFLRVESEHSCLAALIGAQSTGVRTFTATSSQGLALMHELLHWASGARLPIVMAEVNRPGTGMEHLDGPERQPAQRDTGWMQFYCEDAQEVLDTMLMAYRLAEMVNLPAMWSWTPFSCPTPMSRWMSRSRRRWTASSRLRAGVSPGHGPPFRLSPWWRRTLTWRCAGRSPPPWMRRWRLDSVEEKFAGIFGRRYGAVEAVCCDDADIVLVTSGTVTSTARILWRSCGRRGKRSVFEK